MAARAPALLLAAALAAVAAVAGAQDADVAGRLKRMVDERLEEIRAELHREIDRALAGAGPGLELQPASAEFRCLHRLAFDCGLRVARVAPCGAGAALGLVAGDVIVAIGPHAIAAEADVAPALRDLGPSDCVLVIRGHERELLFRGPAGGAGPSAAAGPRQDRAPASDLQPGNAEEIIDRLWKKAVSDVLPGGLEDALAPPARPESGPTQKNPIPGETGRR